MSGPVHTPSEVLELDDATVRDLDLFGEEGQENSLYHLLNRCRTEGGERALRRRMSQPWATAERIWETQDAIAFIDAERQAFESLPSAYLTLNVERYLSSVMPIVRQVGAVEFAFSAFALWMNDEHFYSKIIRGVSLSCRFLEGLRKFVVALEGKTPRGELTALVADLRNLLDHGELAGITSAQTGRWYWQKLKKDQVFRLHQKASLGRLLEVVHEIDALASIAHACREHGFVRPEVVDGETRVEGSGVYHPAVPAAVVNPLQLDQARRVLFLTGPNMAGKTTYLRSAATALYLAHLGAGVPAEAFSFVPVQKLITSVSMSDDLHDGISYFRAEALRVKSVAQAIADGLRVASIMDEPFKGTNIKDAYDASLAVLERFADSEGCLFLVSSHLIELEEALKRSHSIRYGYFEAQEQAARLTFDFVLREGVSSQRLGMRVLEEEGVFTLLDQ